MVNGLIQRRIDLDLKTPLKKYPKELKNKEGFLLYLRPTRSSACCSCIGLPSETTVVALVT